VSLQGWARSVQAGIMMAKAAAQQLPDNPKFQILHDMDLGKTEAVFDGDTDELPVAQETQSRLVPETQFGSDDTADLLDVGLDHAAAMLAPRSQIRWRRTQTA